MSYGFLRSKQILVGGSLVFLFFFIAIFAPWIAPYDYWAQSWEESLQPPSINHFFGTDQYGRDVFSRTIFGARVSLIVALSAASLSGFIGIVLGLLAGYFGRWVDRVIQGLTDIAWALPTLLIGVAMVVIMDPGQMSVTVAIVVGWWAQYSRVVRGEVLSVKENEFIEAAYATGTSHWRIIIKHILPNVIAPAIVLVSVTIGRAIILETMLSFLGIGVQPPTPSWGTMLSNGRQFLLRAPWLAIIPGIPIVIAVLGFNLMGDGLRDVLDPYSRGGE